MCANRLAWGIIGTGAIARKFAESLPTSRTGHLVGVGSRTQAAADMFARDFNSPRAHGTYEALLRDPKVEAVYISTPHPFHAEWAIQTARAGKHILCEKPLAINHEEATAMAEEARGQKVFFMEAFMYRCHPQTAKAVEIVRSGRLGQVRTIEATFAFRNDYNPESRLHRRDLGGGAILDVGCYCMSMARLLAGAAQGKPFAEPTGLKAMGTLGTESGVDLQAHALLSFPDGLQAILSTGMHANLGQAVVVTGTEASLHIFSPWVCEHPISRMEILSGKDREEIEIISDRPLYSLEIDTVAEYLEQGEAPAMPIDDTLGNMAGLDRWREEIGLTYDADLRR